MHGKRPVKCELGHISGNFFGIELKISPQVVVGERFNDWSRQPQGRGSGLLACRREPIVKDPDLRGEIALMESPSTNLPPDTQRKMQR